MKIVETKNPTSGRREVVITPEKGDTAVQVNGEIAKYPGRVERTAVAYQGRSGVEEVVITLDEPLFKKNFTYFYEDATALARCSHCQQTMDAITTGVHPGYCPKWPQRFRS